MAIREKLQDGVKVFEVTVSLRSKLKSNVRVQKLRRGIPTLKAATAIEKELVREAAEEIARIEGAGVTWEELLERYELAVRAGGLGVRPLQANTLQENIATLRRFTGDWLNRVCHELNPADVRRVFQAMANDGYSHSRMKAVKSGVNTVFKWGIEEGLLPGLHHGPTVHVFLGRNKEEKAPQILTATEIQRLIDSAREMKHPWYEIWFMAVNTGMRSGELYALEWSDVDLENKLITVARSYNGRLKAVKSTKAGYWRKVPINSELEGLLINLRATRDPNEPHVLPRVSRWKNGEAAIFLREFCDGIGIPSVNFHALRACFATHLLNSGVSSPVVKKICGWTDEKVMGRYIRLAGVDVAGATESLGFIREGSGLGRKVSTLRGPKRSPRNQF